MELNEAIFNRRTKRVFSSKIIPYEILEKLIKAGIYAPSACNRQAWKFIIVNQNYLKNKIVESGGSKLINIAPQGIIIVYRNDVSANSSLYKDHIQSAAACIQNILLTAHQEKISACWICDLPRPKSLKLLMNIPKNYDIIAYIALGYTKKDNSRLSISHYDNNYNSYKNRKRRFTIQQVISYNGFNVDNINYPSKKFLFLKALLLKRDIPIIKKWFFNNSL